MTLLLVLLLPVAVLAAAWFLTVQVLSARHPEPRWRWDGIDPSVARFPKGFLWGVATAAHQVEGHCDDCNWADWEKETGPDGQPRIKDGQVAGAACDTWNRYPEDIRLMQELGVGAYRLSLEWSRFEPTQGAWDPAVVAHYHEELAALRAAGLQVMVTLHHFTHPRWFEAMGAFEREENLAIFVRFCERIFEEYKDEVDFWCTINEPAVYSVTGYGLGRFPPGKQDFLLMARVQRNLLLAHARVVRAIKALPGGERSRIGVVNNVNPFDPWRRWHLGDWIVARMLDRVFNTAIQDYLCTGVYSVQIPGLVRYEATDPEVKGAGDFQGLNYYSHSLVAWQPDPKEFFRFEYHPDDIRTDMPYALYPEGFKRSLHLVARAGLPIYVTENGIADARDDRRETFIERYLFAMHRAMEDGVDVRGYFYWTLVDNFEWAEGWDMKFGLYELDMTTRDRRLRPGAKALVRAIRERTAT